MKHALDGAGEAQITERDGKRVGGGGGDQTGQREGDGGHRQWLGLVRESCLGPLRARGGRPPSDSPNTAGRANRLPQQLP